ncbi:Lactation elevated protein 1 [Nymphaea thermarum]|nr:Lactation elevated protein 1 [Nymphaea thermarum]
MTASIRAVRHLGGALRTTHKSSFFHRLPSFSGSPPPPRGGHGAGFGNRVSPTHCWRRAFLSPATSLSTQGADSVSGSEGGGPFVEYKRRIASGELLDGDEFQAEILRVLQRLYDELVESADECGLVKSENSERTGRNRKSWLWSRLLSQSSESPVKGLYLFGGVGTGKTMLMDLFFEQLPSDWRKKRIHFHDFMLNVHSRLQVRGSYFIEKLYFVSAFYSERYVGKRSERHKGLADPLDVVAEEICDESILICLDEFMVTDVADALILNRLFRHLFDKGIILVATSNRAPDKLYEGGLQRDLFLPFIATLKAKCVVHEIGSLVDYRKMTSAEHGFYYSGFRYSLLLKEKFQQLVGPYTPRPKEIEILMGRKLLVPQGANGCAYFRFEDLCEKPLGAADYFGLCKHFHTLALEGVPKFALHNRTAAYRFVTLIDVMYENKARFLCTAETSPVGLFEYIVTISDAQKVAPRSSSRSRRADVFDLCVDNELGFAKDRTISRLTEMNSKEYLDQHAAALSEKSDQDQTPRQFETTTSSS